MLFIALLQVFSGISQVQATNEPYPNIAELQIEDLIEKYHIPGAVIAIIHKDSSRIYTYGVAEKQSKTAITANTIFRIGSISKSFVAIAINQLVDEGKINLNDPVKDIIPDIAMFNPWENDNPVRIIHLLEHTSGIDDVHFNEGYNTSANQSIPLGEIFAINPGSRNVRWKPGEYCSYSNDAFSILGLIIEKVTNQPFEDYLKTNIFDKIGATSASFVQTNENVSFFAQGYTNEGLPLEFRQVKMRPSGGLNATVTDLSGFVQMLLNNGVYNNTTVIDSATLQRMLSPASSIPAREGFKPGYGSGFSTFFVNGQRFYGHGGGLPDFNSVFLLHPESELGIVVLINQNSDYFWRIVNKVVSALPIENDKQETIQYAKNEAFQKTDIEGYYTQANYGISLDRFPNYFLSGQKILVQNDTAFIKAFQSDKQALVHVNGNAYKSIDETYESVYFFRNSDGEMMLTISGKSFYKKSAAWKPLFHRLFLICCLVICVTYLCYVFMWLIWRLILKMKKSVGPKSSFGLRLFPLLGIISLIGCLYALIVLVC